MNGRMENRRVLVTHADRYMGPAIIELFRRERAVVQESTHSLVNGEGLDELLADAADIDVLIANLEHDPCAAVVGDIKDADWYGMFDYLVHPLMRLTRAFAPRMAERGHGKIVAITSAAPLRGIAKNTAYCAARGAQNAFVRAAGLEFARNNVQINAVAQNYVANPAYYPDELLESPRFQDHLQRNVPLQRVAHAWESAELALFLASDKSDFIVGQVIPFAGGWATNT